MALDNIQFDATSSNKAGMLRAGLLNLEIGFDTLNNVLENMAHMIDGDGSVEGHFTEMSVRYGFAGNAAAKSGYDELNSTMAKLNTDGSVTNVNAAMQQLFAKMR